MNTIRLLPHPDRNLGTLNPLVLTVDDVLSPEECTALIARIEAAGPTAAPITTHRGFEMRPDIRNNSRVMFDDLALSAVLFERLRPSLPERLEFIERQSKPSPNHTFVIEVDGAVAGACGVHPLTDVYARGAEIGYWLGTPFRGRGVATKAVEGLSRFAFEQLGLARLQAGVFEWNPASARVLEKNGYLREAVRKKSVFKDGALIDSFLYAKVNPLL